MESADLRDVLKRLSDKKHSFFHEQYQHFVKVEEEIEKCRQQVVSQPVAE